jgi:flagellar basal-body rod modification protein FlgD
MDAISATGASAQANQAGSQASTSATSAATDFETFLSLLTAQMKNQDPLKPLASTDFVAQLASFSSVEQQIRTNDSLTQIQQLLGGSSPSGLSAWIGAQVQVLKDPQFEGAPIDVFVAPNTEADRVDLVVQNAAGEEVQRLSVPVRTDVYAWAATLADGTPLANGTYKLAVESFKDGTLIDSRQAPIYDEVIEARLDSGTTYLVLSDGSALKADQVTAVRGK